MKHDGLNGGMRVMGFVTDGVEFDAAYRQLDIDPFPLLTFILLLSTLVGAGGRILILTWMGVDRYMVS